MVYGPHPGNPDAGIDRKPIPSHSRVTLAVVVNSAATVASNFNWILTNSRSHSGTALNQKSKRTII